MRGLEVGLASCPNIIAGRMGVLSVVLAAQHSARSTPVTPSAQQPLRPSSTHTGHHGHKQLGSMESGGARAREQMSE